MFVEEIEGIFDEKNTMSPSKSPIKLTKTGQVRPHPNLITRLNTGRLKTRSGWDYPRAPVESNNNTKKKSQTTNLPESQQEAPPSSNPGFSKTSLVEKLSDVQEVLEDGGSKDSEGGGGAISITPCDLSAGSSAGVSPDGDEQLLTDVLEVIKDNLKMIKDLEEKGSVEKSSNEDLFEFSCSDLPTIYNFTVFEKEVYEDIKIFDQIEEIEKHDHSMMDIKPPTPYGKQKKQGSGKVLHECRFCSKVFMHLGKFLEHEKNHQKDIVCDVCGKTQRSASHLISHRSHNHPELREKPCEVCREVSCKCQGGGGGGPTHEKGGTKRKIMSFRCKTCSVVFDSKSLLVKHQILLHDMHKTTKISKKTLGISKLIEWRKTAEKDLTRALSNSRKFRGS